MAVNDNIYRQMMKELGDRVRLVAVSKTKPAEDIRALYDLGQREFGENYVQELVDKQAQLPKDIRWHFIGHLQSNKVKLIAPFVHLVQGVDSLKLLKEIGRQAARNSRVISCLLQVHIAREESKFGLDAGELEEIMKAMAEGAGIAKGAEGPGELQRGGSGDFRNIKVSGLMGMASFTDDVSKVREEFRGLKALFDKYFRNEAAEGLLRPEQPILSMGMSGDYKIAIEEGSNMVRIGSLLFGERNYL
jgi:PLP dependent protein